MYLNSSPLNKNIMCLTDEDLRKITDEQLLDNFEKAVELDTKDSGNGQSPFDKDQLKRELGRRLKKEIKTPY